MTKTENTAVNRLIEQAHSRSLDADDALFASPPPRRTLPRPFPNRIGPIDPPAPMPRHRIPSSTQTHLSPAPPAPAAAAAAAATATAAAKPADLEDSGLLELEDEDELDVPVTVGEPVVRDDEQAWYQESVGVDRVDEAQLGTRFVRRKSRATSVLLLGAAFATGLVATAVIAWPSRQASVAPVTPPAAPTIAEPAVPAVPPTVVEPAAAPVVEPAVAAPTVVEPAVVEPVVPVVEPEPAAPAAPATLAVELDSEPQGAAVLLVEAGTTITLGATPLSHELDPSRSYEIMFTLAGHKSALVTVDPNKSQRVNVDLASSTATAAPRTDTAVALVEPTPAPAPEPTVERRARPARKAAAKKAPKPARVAKAEPARPASPGGKGGMLMLGSKPPCDIFIDGKPTRLKTPQREIKLAPGSHKITLVNREHKITETFTVDVKAGAPTKVVKDLTKRMK